MNQHALDFDAARATGDAAATACMRKARKIDPDFSEKAEAAILAHLRSVGNCSCEVLTDAAMANGVRCHDARAFGAVFRGLARRGLIRTVGYCMRSKGHGTAGGRVWGLV